MNYGIVSDPVFALHMTPSGHPERPDRITAVINAIESWDQATRLRRIDPAQAQEEWIRAVHTKEHFQRIKSTAAQSFDQLDPDTYTGAESFNIALLAAGSGVKLTENVIAGRLDSGFALIRPPGHHAESRRAMGFCLFNNVAVAADWAIRQPSVDRVAIVDFDVHHGNGTQEIFYARPDVLYVSAHQYPFYPGSGHFTELGEGGGRGYTVNFPVRAGMGNHFYRELFRDFVVPILSQYSPQLILVSAGYDAHVDDPLANMRLDGSGFVELVNLLNAVAKEVCQGRIVYILEGGYNLRALSQAVRTTIATTLKTMRFEIGESEADAYAAYRSQMRQAFSPYWKL